METKHISNRKKIGFITYDMEVAEVSEIVKEGVEIINTQNEQVSLAPEHQEVLNRIDIWHKLPSLERNLLNFR